MTKMLKTLEDMDTFNESATPDSLKTFFSVFSVPLCEIKKFLPTVY